MAGAAEQAEALKNLMKELQEQNRAQMESLMEAFVKQTERTEKPKETDTTYKEPRKEVFDEKFTKNIKGFDGKQENWKSWILKFKNKIKMKSQEAHKFLGMIEQKPEPCDDEFMIEHVEYQNMSSELYDVLCDLMEGTALIQIQNVEDNNGLEAYRKIFRFYNPVTPAKLLKKLVEIVKPPKIEKMEDSILMLEQWKLKLLEATNDFGK